MSEKLIPHSIAAEESVVGGILVHSKRLVDVLPLVRAEDFYDPKLRAAFEAIVELDATASPVDAVSVVERMKSTGTIALLNSVGGDDYLFGLMSKIVTVENLAYHAALIAKRARRRRWAAVFYDLTASAYGDGDDDEWFVDAEKRIVELTTRDAVGSDVVPLRKALNEFSNELGMRVERRKKGGTSLIGVSTGYGRVDEMLSGLRKGCMYVVAGRPKMGKSALAMNMVARSAKLGTAWLLFSLEMPNLELAQRLVSSEAKMDNTLIAQGDINGIPDWQRVGGAVGRLADLPIWTSDRSNVTISQIRSYARRWRAGMATKFESVGVMLDYMQLVDVATKKHGSREQDVSEISRGIKLLARDLDCPVIALSQLNRQLEQRTDKRPMLSDLRESGAIEQDADAVIFVYRDSVYHEEDTCTTPQCIRCQKRDIAEIIVGAQRQGPTGTVEMLWKGAYTTFEALATNRPEGAS